ncbi:MAG: ribonuclease III [Planctomycetes bacterium]|nr:ribonuclease III [Planctomycetota bacterium]
MVTLEVLQQAERILEYHFQNSQLLKEALTHSSCSANRRDSNERLEFLGDAVLGLIICERGYQQFPEWLEGQLTILKSAVVSRKTCAAVSNNIGLTDLIRVGPGMERPGRLPGSLAAGVFESVVGAIYLDGGFEAARTFILRNMQPWIDHYADGDHQLNFKSMLQQYAQRQYGGTPTYEVLAEEGPDHKKIFRIRVHMQGQVYEATLGRTKKETEQEAARLALLSLGLLDATGDEINSENRNQSLSE